MFQKIPLKFCCYIPLNFPLKFQKTKCYNKFEFYVLREFNRGFVYTAMPAPPPKYVASSGPAQSLAGLRSFEGAMLGLESLPGANSQPQTTAAAACSPSAMWTRCPHCGTHIRTTTRLQVGQCSLLCAVLLCCLCCSVLAWLPLVCPLCQDVVHICSRCGAKLGALGVQRMDLEINIAH